ncbi:MAG: beta-galactosidase [Spirochaetes bacterium]|nr:beta-galactosidase [Spirochaetota bacterium]
MGWNRTREQQIADLGLVTNMNVNALRTWKGMDPNFMKDLDEFNLAGLPQVQNLSQPKSEYLSGKISKSLVWTDPRATSRIYSDGAALASAHQTRQAPFAYLLGNEYTTIGQREPKVWDYGCCDPTTLGAYRSWLEARFHNIEGLNQATGASWTSFGDVGFPRKGVDSKILGYEYAMFLRASFGRFLRAGYEGIRSVDTRTPVSYARLLSRWDLACEDGDFSFQEVQGENLYFSWGKDWGDYAIRLARLIGPSRPALVTETGFATLGRSEQEFGRLTRQGLWLCAFHPEIFGIFTFAFCDEWYKNGQANNDPGTEKECFYGMVTADRKMKSTGEAMKETYATFKSFDGFMRERASDPVLLLSDQAVDEIFTTNRAFFSPIAKWLYSEGIDFRMITSLQPGRWSTICPRLVLVDGMFPVDPDGHSGFLTALLQYLRDGGQILYLSPNPWTGTYPTPNLPVELRDAPNGVAVTFGSGKLTVVRHASEPEAWKQEITAFLASAPRASLLAKGGPAVYSRVFRTATQGTFALVLNLNLAMDPLDVPLESVETWDLVASDGAKFSPQKGGGLLQSLDTFALFKAR